MPGSSRLQPLEIKGKLAVLRPDTDPKSVERVLAAAETLPRIQFAHPLPPALLDAVAAALAVHPEVPLRVYGREVDPSLDFLRRFRHVRHLTVEVWNATDFSLLGEFRALESLGLGQTRSHAPSLDFLRSLPQLTELWIEAHDKGFDAVGEVAGLRCLSLRVPRAKSLAALAGHPKLTVFEMDFGGIRDLAPLTDVAQLRGGRRLSGEDVPHAGPGCAR
jgi:hypothetical protein